MLELGRMQGVSRSNELPDLLEQKDLLVLMGGRSAGESPPEKKQRQLLFFFSYAWLSMQLSADICMVL